VSFFIESWYCDFTSVVFVLLLLKVVHSTFTRFWRAANCCEKFPVWGKCGMEMAREPLEVCLATCRPGQRCRTAVDETSVQVSIVCNGWKKQIYTCNGCSAWLGVIYVEFVLRLMIFISCLVVACIHAENTQDEL